MYLTLTGIEGNSYGLLITSTMTVRPLDVVEVPEFDKDAFIRDFIRDHTFTSWEDAEARFPLKSSDNPVMCEVGGEAWSIARAEGDTIRKYPPARKPDPVAQRAMSRARDLEAGRAELVRAASARSVVELVNQAGEVFAQHVVRETKAEIERMMHMAAHHPDQSFKGSASSIWLPGHAIQRS